MEGLERMIEAAKKQAREEIKPWLVALVIVLILTIFF